MTRNFLKALPAALLAIGFAAGAHAQTSPAPSGAADTPSATRHPNARNLPSATDRSDGHAKSSLSHGDREFIKNAAKGGMAEVELAKIAQERASSPEVKQFARKMEHDHSQANEELRTLAQEKGVTMPGGPKLAENHEASKLSKLQGQAFDREYMDHMVKDHKKDVKEFDKMAQKAKDPDVKAFAQKIAPKLHEHLQLAQNADSAVGGKQAKKSSGKEARNDASRDDEKTSMR